MPTLNWIGKDKVVSHHQEVPFKVLKKEYTFNGDKSDNFIIHGDNLVALKSLLPKYENRIDIMYIDPPYNTGNENWVYNDNVNDPRIKKWIGEVVGAEGEDLSRHDKWLCMMYPRLKLLHKLLSDTGILFISIDDNELHNLILICKEIFGNANTDILIWRKNGRQSNTKNIVRFKTTHEYVVACFKNKAKTQIGKIKHLPNWKKEKKNVDKDPRGPWESGIISKEEEQSRPDSPNYYSITSPSGNVTTREFYYPKEELLRLLADNRIYFPKAGEGVPRLKIFENEEQEYFFDSIMDQFATFTDAKGEIEEILGDRNIFPTPKPVKLVKEIIRATSKKDSIILDSFAGSGTTGHAVLDLNNEDGGNRKFIMVEMMDYCEDITSERMRRVINGYSDKEPINDSFTYYSLGDNLFDNFGNINPAVDIQDLRQYVYYTETKKDITQMNENKYYLGTNYKTDYYFYYEKDKVCELNYSFLSTLNRKNDSIIIYADTCTLGENDLNNFGIIFKKTPRDIVKI